MANAPFRDAATIRSTTKPTTSSPGIKAAPPGYRIWDNPAPNITGYGIPAAGNPPRPPKPHHPAGPHPPAGTTKANTRTGNHHTGQTSCRRCPGTHLTLSTSGSPQAKKNLNGSCTPHPPDSPRGFDRLNHRVQSGSTTGGRSGLNHQGFRQAQPPGIDQAPVCPPDGARPPSLKAHNMGGNAVVPHLVASAWLPQPSPTAFPKRLKPTNATMSSSAWAITRGITRRVLVYSQAKMTPIIALPMKGPKPW
jgi:hypothetical protein